MKLPPGRSYNNEQLKQEVAFYFNSILSLDRERGLVVIDADRHPELFQIFAEFRLKPEISMPDFFAFFKTAFVKPY